MSKPIARGNPAASATRAKPTTPPAGPERMLSLPTNRSPLTSPPADVTIRKSFPGNDRCKAAIYDRSTGFKYESITVVSPRERPIRPACDAVRERPADVDPEFPARFHNEGN